MRLNSVRILAWTNLVCLIILEIIFVFYYKIKLKDYKAQKINAKI